MIGISLVAISFLVLAFVAYRNFETKRKSSVPVVRRYEDSDLSWNVITAQGKVEIKDKPYCTKHELALIEFKDYNNRIKLHCADCATEFDVSKVYTTDEIKQRYSTFRAKFEQRINAGKIDTSYKDLTVY